MLRSSNSGLKMEAEKSTNGLRMMNLYFLGEALLILQLFFKPMH